MSDATNLPGALGAYAAAFKANDVQRMRQIVLQIVAADEIVLPHPKTGIMCRCRSSTRWDIMENVLFFSDGAGGNQWALVQMTSFFQFAVTDTSVLPIASGPDARNKRLVSELQGGKFDDCWKKQCNYGGLAVYSARPYHYFYDQLIHLPDIIKNLPEKKRAVHIDGTSFLSPESVWKIPTKYSQSNKYYVFPNVVGGLRLHSKGTDAFFKLADRMERAIVSEFLGSAPDTHADLVLWVGITGQKRSWVEQVEGYAQIVRELSKSFSDILVYLDGFTAPEGDRITNDADTQVVKEIESEIGEKARVKSLVGLDYPTKVELCQSADLFIANGGMGCFVPLRVCRKSGLLHSNANIWTFRGDKYPGTVVYTPPHIIHEVASADKKQAQFVSYSIAWQEIYNRLLPILFKVRGVQLQPIPLPSADRVSSELDRNLFRQLSHSLGSNPAAADVLREVAVRFEQKGDIPTALMVMEQAHLQRPNGPFISRKLKEYRSSLGAPPIHDESS